MNIRQKTIEGSHITLRPLIQDDLSDLHALCSDQNNAYDCGFLKHRNIEETKSLLKSWIAEEERYALLKDSSFIGYIAVNPGENRDVELAYCLMKNERNQGYMSEAVGLLCKELFKRGVETIWGFCRDDNIASAKVLLKNGFLYTESRFFSLPFRDMWGWGKRYCYKNPEYREVVVVDEGDRTIASCLKEEAHIRGLLHRAFSLFIEDNNGRILLQKRASGKYHCGGLWSNACCSHPQPHESLRHAVEFRAKEELGIVIKDAEEAGCFKYRAEFENGLIEHEIDHVFIACCNQLPLINPDEVEEYIYCTPVELEERYRQNPQSFTPWFYKAWQIIKKRKC